jgi:hypothetical protein
MAWLLGLLPVIKAFSGILHDLPWYQDLRLCSPVELVELCNLSFRGVAIESCECCPVVGY